MFLDPQTSKLGGHPKSKLLASSQPDRWPQDIKTFEFDVFGPQNVEFEGFNILGVMPLDGKSFDLDVFGFLNLQTGGSSQIEAFSIQPT